MFYIFPIALAALAAAAALPVAPRAAPATYNKKLLENYDTYHTRYLAIGCHKKHGDRKFFNQCCRPLLKTQKLADRPAECKPKPVSGTEDLPFCDEIDDEDDDDDLPSPPPAPKPPAPKPPANPAKPPTPKPPTTPPASGSVKGGFATFYFQNGNASACGNFRSDNDLIAAIDGRRYGNLGQRSSLCGRKVRIVNPKNKKAVTVTIEDACPTCNNRNSIDLSRAAFERIATLPEGLVPIEWDFV